VRQKETIDADFHPELTAAQNKELKQLLNEYKQHIFRRVYSDSPSGT